jgi:hypothetical protein
MKLWRVRRSLYRGARILGDIEAIEHGPKAIVKRVERKWLWRWVGRVLGKLTR